MTMWYVNLVLVWALNAVLPKVMSQSGGAGGRDRPRFVIRTALR